MLWVAALGVWAYQMETDQAPRSTQIPGTVYNFNWIYLWSFLFFVWSLYEWYTRGRDQAKWTAYWTERASTLTGNIAEIGELLLGRKGGGRPVAPERIQAGLLQQVVEVIGGLTSPASNVKILSCVLVPVDDAGAPSDAPTALQAVTYNELRDRRHSRVPLTAPGPASEAYETKKWAVVADTSVPPYDTHFRDRPYKSVVGFPCIIAGRVLAVVTVDATQTNFFTKESVEKLALDAEVAPYLKLIALAQIAQTKGGARGRR